METPDPERLGLHGELVPGPPWIFGLRGTPREAPENTLASLRRALELGLDGLQYEVRACASGELVLLADPTLDRTSDAHGALAERTPSELHRVDAGGWFSKAFTGEPLAFLEEALGLRGNAAGSWPQHLIEVREPATLPALARALSEHGRKLSVRVMSSRRSLSMEARDLGLSPLHAVALASEDERRFARDERIAAVGARAAAWGTPSAAAEWSTERVALDVDDPDELLAVCRRPFNGLVTTEPRRALAVRALAHLAPADSGPYPLRASELEIAPQYALSGEGEWCGSWEVMARLRNPFAFELHAALELVVRRGAFDAPELPLALRLAPGQEHEARLRVSGGSWSPGGDPLLVARLSAALPECARADARARKLRPFVTLDWPLRRLRRLVLRDSVLRLPLLRESPRDPPASVTVRRHRSDLLVALEDPGDLAPARLLVHLEGELYAGARGLRLPLLPAWDQLRDGVAFSVGIQGLRATPRGPRTVVRRWSGGLPDTLAAGEPGRLILGR